MSKYEYAAMMALGVAYTVSRKNDKYAISTFNDTIDINAPKRGTKHLLALTDRLANRELSGTTDLDACSHKYEKLIKSRSLVVIISDFMEDIEHIKASVTRLSKNDLILIQIMDPFERNLPIRGDSLFYDMETGSKMKTYLGDTFRKNYLNEMEKHIAAIDHMCKKTGSHFYSFTTDAPVFDSFLKIIERGA
jgi:uncharacterized protein (DUF58 family)